MAPPVTGDDSNDTTINARNTNKKHGGGVQFASEHFEEGHADGSVTASNDADEVGDLGDSKLMLRVGKQTFITRG